MHVSRDPADLLRPRSSAAWTRIAPSRTRSSWPTRIGAQKLLFGAFEMLLFEAVMFAIARRSASCAGKASSRRSPPLSIRTAVSAGVRSFQSLRFW